jgi:micrococcal nuclease
MKYLFIKKILLGMAVLILLGAGCATESEPIETSGKNADVQNLINTAEEQRSSTPSLPTSSNCDIKGNISSSGEKIYHEPGCGSYSRTIIDESAGEQWFCSENEAEAAGWRKAKNCN